MCMQKLFNLLQKKFKDELLKKLKSERNLTDQESIFDEQHISRTWNKQQSCLGQSHIARHWLRRTK